MDPKVDKYFSTLEKWRDELEKLRTILLECGLNEELKWGSPCYSFQKKNISIIGGLKDCCVLSFFKGALLNDTHNILIKPGDNTQSARIIRFTNAKEIVKLKPILKAYIFEAVELEKAGMKVMFKKVDEFKIPVELQKMLNKIPDFKIAFNSLTPGRQRGYILYFSAAKQSATRTARIEKSMERIFKGKGLNE